MTRVGPVVQSVGAARANQFTCKDVYAALRGATLLVDGREIPNTDLAFASLLKGMKDTITVRITGTTLRSLSRHYL